MLDITSISYMILLIEIMIVSGALGGMVSALLSWGDDQPFLGLIFKHTLTGIVMAMTVPLILNMFSSDLLDTGQAKPLRLFILGGLCIFVALFSTRVLESVLKSRLKHEEKHYQVVPQKEGQFGIIEEKIDTTMPILSDEKVKTPDNQLKILESLAGLEGAKLTLADLLRYARMPQKDFDETLSLLMAKGLVAQELSGGKKLYIVLTPRGRQQLDKMSGK